MIKWSSLSLWFLIIESRFLHRPTKCSVTAGVRQLPRGTWSWYRHVYKMNPVNHVIVSLRRCLSLVLVAIVNAETVGKPWSLWWWIKLFDLSKGNSWRRWWKWAPWPQLHLLGLLRFTDAYFLSVVLALWPFLQWQSSKVQTNSLYVWLHLETTYFQTSLELLVSLFFSTPCSGLWPKAAEIFPSTDFPLSACVMSTSHGKWTGLQFTLDATQPVGFDPTLRVFPQHV